MHIIALILSSSVSILLFFSAFFKLLSIRELEKMLKDLIKILPSRSIKLVAILIPLVEITLSISIILFGDFFIVNILVIMTIMIFIILNFHAMINLYNPKECLCFGKVIRSKMGIGGLVQSLLLLLSISVALFFGDITLIEYIGSSNSSIVFLLVITSLIWTIVMLVTRVLLEIIVYPQGE